MALREGNKRGGINGFQGAWRAYAGRAGLAAILLASLALVGGAPFNAARADALIKADEAKLPDQSPPATMRGITRGPSVKLVTPDAKVSSPFAMKVKFEAHGGAKIDPASVKVTYLKSPSVDLTDRVKAFVTPEGIDMAKAEVPPGDHAIRVEVKDSEGRAGIGTFALKVAER